MMLNDHAVRIVTCRLCELFITSVHARSQLQSVVPACRVVQFFVVEVQLFDMLQSSILHLYFTE